MIELEYPQGSEEWLDARRGIPTASEFHRFFTPGRMTYGDARFRYMADLLLSKMDFKREDPDDKEFVSTYWMERGTKLEPEAREMYEFSKDVQVRQTGLILMDDRKAGCSPDGLVDEDPEGPGGVEIKCLNPSLHFSLLIREKLGESPIPNDKLCQMHGCMIITERKWWDAFYYCPGFPPIEKRMYWQHTTTTVEALKNGKTREKVNKGLTDELAKCLEQFKKDLETARTIL